MWDYKAFLEVTEILVRAYASVSDPTKHPKPANKTSVNNTKDPLPK